MFQHLSARKPARVTALKEDDVRRKVSDKVEKSKSVWRKKEILQSRQIVGVIGVSIPNAIPNRRFTDSLKTNFSIDSIDLK